MDKPKTKRRRLERGQSLVEFAIMLVVLLTILMGVLDLGRAFYALIALHDMVGEGANFANLFPTYGLCATSSSFGYCDDPNNIEYRTLNASPAGLVDKTAVHVVTTFTYDSVSKVYTVEVQGTYDFKLVTFVISSIIGGDTLPLQAVARSTFLSMEP